MKFVENITIILLNFYNV